MNGLVAWWARNGIAANLLMIVAFIGGIFGFLSLEKEAFPAGDWNGASVSIAWPGASPQDVEDQIVVRLEEVVADIDGLKRLTGAKVWAMSIFRPNSTSTSMNSSTR